jgi:hypothetical protein
MIDELQASEEFIRAFLVCIFKRAYSHGTVKLWRLQMAMTTREIKHIADTILKIDPKQPQKNIEREMRDRMHEVERWYSVEQLSDRNAIRIGGKILRVLTNSKKNQPFTLAFVQAAANVFNFTPEQTTKPGKTVVFALCR